MSGQQSFPCLLNPDWSIKISGASRMQDKSTKKGCKKCYTQKKNKKEKEEKHTRMT